MVAKATILTSLTSLTSSHKTENLRGGQGSTEDRQVYEYYGFSLYQSREALSILNFGLTGCTNHNPKSKIQNPKWEGPYAFARELTLVVHVPCLLLDYSG